MADLGSKSALKTSVNNRVFTNTSFETSSEDIRSSFEDTIDTLKLGVINVASYAALKTLVTNSQLEVGMWYAFPYETKHVVEETTVLNTATPGYTPITETLMIQAKTTSTFFHQAKSFNYPSDNILYDFTLDTAQSSGDRSGLIYYRHDKVNDIEAWFDVRNQIVARYGLDTSTIVYTSGTVNRGQIKLHGGVLKIALQDGLSNLNNFRQYDDISVMMQYNVYSKTDPINMFGNSIPINTSTPFYSQSISGSTNVHLASGTKNILIQGCSNFVADKDTVAKSSFVSCLGISIGFAAGRMTLVGCNQIDLDDTAFRIKAFNSNKIKVEQDGRDQLYVNVTDTKIDAHVWTMFMMNTIGNKIGSNCTSLMLNRSSNYNIINQNCSGITLGNSIQNVFDPGCSDIQIFSGGENKFGAGCDTINLLGEQDSAFTGGGYYSPYSEMLRNSFGVGCSNITFDVLGGRGNQFGDECRNLLFTSVGQSYRVIGCSFARGIQNKTFQAVIHGCAFIAPCQQSKVITSNDWYSQAIWINTDNTLGSVKERTWQESNVNPGGYLVVGYKQDGATFFGSSAKNADGTTASGFKIQGNIPTGHAFIWTTDGFPLSATLTAGLGKPTDPTLSLNR